MLKDRRRRLLVMLLLLLLLLLLLRFVLHLGRRRRRHHRGGPTRVGRRAKDHLNFISDEGFDGFPLGLAASEDDALGFHLVEQRDQIPQLVETGAEEGALFLGRLRQIA